MCVAALVLRITFALMVTWLLGIVGLVLAGGLLLLWVAWKYVSRHYCRRIARRIRPARPKSMVDERSGLKAARGFAAAAWSVALADVSMSLDNVLGGRRRGA